MEPFTIAAIAGAAGGVTGKLIEKSWDVGVKWLDTYFKDHHPKAREAAQHNTLDFLSELASRVRGIEETVKNIPDAKKQIEDALSDPDFSALLHDAMIASARTESPEKHKLLARIVSERLLARQESLVALAGNLACDAVPHLSPKHLYCLGIMNLVYHIRPYPFPPKIPPKIFNDWWTNWLSNMLSPMMTIGKMTPIDYAHLVSVSCITYDYLGSRNLKGVLSPPESSEGSEFEWDADKFFADTKIGKELSELWKAGMEHAVPTSAGQLIGIYVRDLLTGTTTNIRWDS
ncbi:hypothetical protein ES703_61369 [subsurface metagenome]